MSVVTLIIVIGLFVYILWLDNKVTALEHYVDHGIESDTFRFEIVEREVTSGYRAEWVVYSVDGERSESGSSATVEEAKDEIIKAMRSINGRSLRAQMGLSGKVTL